MSASEIISIIVTIIGVFSFVALFTILYRVYAMAQINDILQGKKDLEIIDEVIYEMKSSVRTRRKIIKVIKAILYYLCLIIIIPIFVLSLISHFNNDTLMIGNKSLMVVGSDSMSYQNESNTYLKENNLNNQFETYDILVLERVENYSDLKQYDIIAFRNDKGINIIHRIKEFKYVDGLLVMVTRGDANNGDDTYHPTINDVIGRVTDIRIKGLGMFIVFVKSYAGIITIFSLVYCILMIDHYSSKIEKTQNNRTKLLEKVFDYNSEIDIDEMSATYHETIYYQGFEYCLDEKGLVSKKPINNKNTDIDNNTLVKEIINENNEIVTTKKIQLKDERKRK